MRMKIMMMIYPYKSGSESAKFLSEATGFKRIKLKQSRFRGGLDKTIVNWGSTSLSDEALKCTLINPPEAVRRASNKRKFFKLTQEAAEGPRTPEWSVDPQYVLEAVKGGSMWLARTVLAGHSGDGIVIMEKENDFVQAPLYTKYVKKKDEFRVHVCRGEVFDIQRKAKKEGEDNPNWKIRNYHNGFIYMRSDNHQTPEDVLVQAVKALNVTGLDFGAVDVIWNEYKKEAYVLEVNTAPGLSGTTLVNYVEMIKGL